MLVGVVYIYIHIGMVAEGFAGIIGGYKRQEGVVEDDTDKGEEGRGRGGRR